MPTITYVLNAINRMSSPFEDAAGAVAKLEAAERSLQTVNDRLAAAETALAGVTDKTGSAFTEAAAKVAAYTAALKMAEGRVAAAATNEAVLAAATNKAVDSFNRWAAYRQVADISDQTKTAILAEAAAQKIASYEDYQRVDAEMAATKAAIMSASANRGETVTLEQLMKASDEMTAALAGEDAALRGTSDAMNKLTVSSAAATVAQKAVKDQTAAGGIVAGTAYRGWLGLWGILGRKVNLFGGALQIGLLHLLVDVFAEIVAVVLPAALALTAWGIAASDAFRAVYTQVTNLHTVADATGKSFGPLTGGLEALHRAVTPEVYQLFGDALLVMGAHAGAFAKVVLATNNAIRGLADRLTIALTKGNGFGQFMSNAATDVSKLGELLGNLGGALGAIIKEMPGVAEVLLNVLLVLSRIIEVVAQAAGKLIYFTLAGHGIIIWVGLAVTALKVLWTWLVSLGTATVGWAQKQLVAKAAAQASAGAYNQNTLALTRQAEMADASAVASGRVAASYADQRAALVTLTSAQGDSVALTDAQAAAMDRLAVAAEGTSGKLGIIAVAEDGTAVAAGEAATATGLLDGAMAALSAVNPLVWVAAAAVAIGFLVVKFGDAQTAVQKWTAAMQTALQNSSLVNFARNASNDLGILANHIGTTQVAMYKLQQAGQAFQTVTVGTRGTYQVRQATAAYAAQESNLAALRGEYTKITDAQALFSYRQNYLNKNVQQGAGSLGLLTAAGVSTKLMLTDNKQALAQIVVQVQATIAGYKAMGQTGSTLGNDLQVLNRTATAQYQAMQKLNAAWDQFIGDVTGTQNSLDTVIQGFHTLASSGQTVREHLGGTTNEFQGMGKAIDGLTQKDVALNQAFTNQVVNLNAMFDSWRTAGLASNLFTKGVKDGIAPLVTYAKGSKEATAQLIALAQEAGYHGPESMKALIKWLGNTSNATANLKKIGDQATVQEALLTSQMGKQGEYIAHTLLNELNNAVIAYGGTKKAVDAYAKAIANQGAQSDAARAARQRLIADILQTGHNAEWSKGKIAGMISTVLGIPVKRAIQIVMTGNGSYVIHGSGYVGGPSGRSGTGRLGVGPSGHITTGQMKAGGGYIRGPGTSTSDSIPAYLSAGEYVVKAAAVAKYGTHMMNMINTQRFAGGGQVQPAGVVLAGNTDVLSGRYAVSSYNSFEKTFEDSMISAMRASIQRAAAAAMAFFGSGVSASGPLQQFARKLLAAYGWSNQWTQFNDVVMRESGWNVHATNPSSGAYGIPQALPASKMASAGSDWMTSGYTQLRWMMAYIKSVYGSPAGAWNSEMTRGYYDRGGWLPTGTSIAVNNTGQPERVLPPGHRPGIHVGKVEINHVPGYSTPKDVEEAMASLSRRFWLSRV